MKRLVFLAAALSIALPAIAAELPDLGGRPISAVTENAYVPLNFADPATGQGIGWEYDAFNEIAAQFQAANPGVKVVYNFGGTPALRTQLEQGARADVFASANLEQMDLAVKNGLVAAGAPKSFARNKLTIVVPKDNPARRDKQAFAGWAPEVYCIGLRNVWKFSFDRETGTCWGGDVGQNLWEMVYILKNGGNYGWSVMEGTHSFRPRQRQRGSGEQGHHRKSRRGVSGCRASI